MKRLTCRLADLMWARHTDLNALSDMTGIDAKRLRLYADDALDDINLREAEEILAALGCNALSELYELVEDGPVADEDAHASFDEWHSPCPKGGRHDWYKDMDVSNTVYQEYECRACGQRIHLIW